MDRPVMAIATLVIAFLVSLVATRGVLSFALKRSLLDQLGDRRVSTVRLPRIGGIGIAAGFSMALGATLLMPTERFPEERERVLLLLGAGLLLFLATLPDDLRGMPALVKLGIHLGVAAIVALPRLAGEDHGIVIDRFNLPVAGQVTLPVGAAIALTIVWLAGMINTMNLIDGLDGLAGSLVVVASAILFVHTYFWPRDDPQFTISLIPAALAGASLGFLVFNWHPARIIMGDAGAYFLGFALAVASIIGGAKIATALLALGLPILDVAWVIIYRLRTGSSPLAADRGHLHHRLLDLGLGQGTIVTVVSGLSLAFGLLALLLPSRELKLAALGAVALVLLASVVVVASEDGGAGRRVRARFRLPRNA